MKFARPSGMKALLAITAVFLASCTGSLPPITPVPVEPIPIADAPTTRAPTQSDPQTSTRDTATTRSAYEPPTVLPTIIGHRRVAPPSGSVAGGFQHAKSGGSGGSGDTVRVALALAQTSARVSATGDGDCNVYDGSADRPVFRVHSGESYLVEPRNGMLVVTASSGVRGFRGPLVMRAGAPGALVALNGHRYRGDLLLETAADGMMAVNRLSVEDYLRGVVPLEIGPDRTPFEAAAVKAQAIAARSYAYTRINDSRPYDLLATVADQVYGGVDAERPVSDAAIEATRNMVLMYQGRVINAPYHANSGGTTASASEVWRTGDEPYLVSVSDRIPGTDRFYDEDSPKFSWTRSLDGSALAAAASRYLPQYAGAPRSGVGAVHAVTLLGRTQSGRVAAIAFDTDAGRFTVRGNDVRFVLRAPGGDLLPSTLFSFEASTNRRGYVGQLTIHGNGNGHGVGMDQWGAIARARAGQDFVTILRVYYPGTTVGRVI